MSEIRFDPATGTLHGVPVLPVPELIARAREERIRFITGNFWDPLGNCGCAIGVNARIADPGGNAMTNSISILKIETYTPEDQAAAGIIFGFDNGMVEGGQRATPMMLAGREYGVAVREAVAAADLWQEGYGR